ncbi:MAG: hypothetical protein O3C28_09280, partial [Proteobacteria bacterium]|nr:hypothetical protein [Pseudomonadota bacterium]
RRHPANRGITLFLADQKFNQAAHVGRIQPSERTVRIRRLNNAPVSAQQELRRLNNSATIFPPSAEQIGGFSANALADRIAQFGGNFTRLISRIYACGVNRNTQFFKLCLALFEAG